MEYTKHAPETSLGSYILYKYTVYCDRTQVTITTIHVTRYRCNVYVVCIKYEFSYY